MSRARGEVLEDPQAHAAPFDLRSVETLPGLVVEGQDLTGRTASGAARLRSARRPLEDLIRIGMTVVHAERSSRRASRPIIRRAREVIDDGPTYVTFDVDSIDPGLPPAPGRRRRAA